MARHFEPFVHLAGLTHDDVLVAWGGFWFEDPDDDHDDWHIVRDADVTAGPDGRQDTIGVRSRPYGDARVVVRDVASGEVAASASTSQANHVWVRGLQPDTDYAYEITVDGEPWATGPRFDWVLDASPGGRDLHTEHREYDTRFRTFPSPDQPAPVRFAVIGDYGVGILAAGGAGERQLRLARALERAVDHAGVRFVISTGDNVYLGEEDTVAGTGDDDHDWYFSFYEPYRYVISRVPVYPSVGNHDSSDTEVADNRDQLADNMFTEVRFADGVEVERASVDPGMYYRFRFGADLQLVAIDTTMATSLDESHYFDHPTHRAFLEESFPDDAGGSSWGPRWRVPFSHHPPYCAGPAHDNMPPLIDRVVPLLQRSDVHVMFSGHEHNFQYAHVDGIDYVVSGAGGKVRDGEPDRLEEAGTRRWAAEGHFLVVDVEGDRMTIHPVTDVHRDGSFTYLVTTTPDGDRVTGPIVVDR